jgi:hypothetical protein
VVTSPAELLAALPITAFMKAGDLRLAGGRLTFTTEMGEVLLDAPLDELHSVAAAATGIHLWNKRKRLRFAFRGAHRDVAALWTSTLTPLVGVPPAGLRVPPPWPKLAWTFAVIGITLFLVAAIVVLTTLNS